jgi:two-component system sporulation sensor kinase A
MLDNPDDPEPTRAAGCGCEPSEPAGGSRAAGGADLVVRADATGVILYVSSNFRSLGYEPDELVGRFGVDFVHPDDRASFTANRGRLFGRDMPGVPVTREFRYRRKDGSWAWLEGHPMIMPSFDGRLSDIVGVFCDVTERREMGDALRAQAQDARSR